MNPLRVPNRFFTGAGISGRSLRVSLALPPSPRELMMWDTFRFRIVGRVVVVGVRGAIQLQQYCLARRVGATHGLMGSRPIGSPRRVGANHGLKADWQRRPLRRDHGGRERLHGRQPGLLRARETWPALEFGGAALPSEMRQVWAVQLCQRQLDAR